MLGEYRMLQLPELVTESGKWRLPLSDQGAACLLSAFVEVEAEQRVPLFTEALRVSPSFLLWAICCQDDWRKRAPKNVDEVAIWLAPRALADLRWSAPTEEQAEEQWRDLTARSIHIATEAATLAKHGSKSGRHGGSLVEQAFLHGLLHAAPEWLSSCGPAIRLAQATSRSEPLPAWLLKAVRAIDQGEPKAKALALVAKSLRQWRQEQGNAAFTPGGKSSSGVSRGTSDSVSMFTRQLPGLITRLRRLEQLENDYQIELEDQKLASLREFAYGASHEINNPLANISTRAQTLLREEANPERRRKLATINTQAFRAHEMISDVMLFAKPPELIAGPVQVTGIVDEVVAELATLAADQGTRLVCSFADNVPEIQGDRVQLAVALRSLCINAMEALGADGIVEISARQATSPQDVDSGVEIVVRDTGPGISPDARQHLFDPFYSGREAGRGLGLGLSKCWRIVTMHGGQIDVASGPDQGATFTIRLPRAIGTPSCQSATTRPSSE
jgi:signal transduction histidine kinase